MKNTLYILMFLLLSGHSYGQEKQIPTTEVDDKEYYTWITYLSEGATLWTENKQTQEQGTAFRVVIITSEIYDNIILEKVSYGLEGGGKRIISQRKVDLERFWEAFGLKGEIAGVKFLGWLNWNAFSVGIGDKIYLIEDLSLPKVKVTRINE